MFLILDVGIIDIDMSVLVFSSGNFRLRFISFYSISSYIKVFSRYEQQGVYFC